ncbi:peptidase E [Halobacillus sp. A5]|uniref:Type 1 glutamine amidotransferase-like domain-containing protein n=1 Tax=Halobacillus sp. A5 TaxID=2880263 RepID=UPI0020A672E5|nr:peptidase E [Halobacillus sp. A5]MCP3029350.1 peptidase E [Halobacillus sp. A5]
MKQIIAMGGGGFSMEPDNPLLDTYVLEQAADPCPNILFVGTASGDVDSYIEKFYRFFEHYPCIPDHLSLFKPSTRNIREKVLQQDIIYVGGGNTKNLLALWKEWGLDNILKEAWEKGIILTGVSAGAICWFEQGVTDSYGDYLEPLNCLGFLQGSCCPHYDGEKERRPVYREFVEAGTLAAGYALDDGAAIHFTGQKIKRIVGSRKNARAYKLQAKETLQETAMAVEFLGEIKK